MSSTTETDDGLLDRARAWAAADPDPETRLELERLIEARDLVELRARMGSELDFGTAGLRGPVGAGPARMNRAVVARAVRAFAEYLLARVPDARTLPVVVGHDARPSSPDLANTAVGVLLAAGIPVRRFVDPVPTPLVAYAARALAASGALVVTASHNPSADNGLKIYGPSATQLVPPADQDVARRREQVGPAAAIPLRPPTEAGEIGAWMLDRYISEQSALVPGPPAPRALKIAYTPLHGLGTEPVRRALATRGFTDFEVVPEQAEVDGTFPTAPSPNPELPGTLDRVLALAERVRADLVLANDPDVDRLAAAAPLPSGRYHIFSGNEIGALLADFVLEHSARAPVPLIVSSVVSTPLIGRIAEAHGARAERTLTGFKWIWAAARAIEAEGGARFVFGCEEAIGFSVGPLVRDKDGISAALWLAELAARCRSDGKTLVDRLHELYRRHGVWGSAQRALQGQGPLGVAAFRDAVERLVASPPEALEGEALSGVIDYRRGAESRPPWLGAAELFELRYGDASRVLIRPSGTEPKLKIYADCEVPLGADAPEAAARRARARAEALAQQVADRVVVQ